MAGSKHDRPFPVSFPTALRRPSIPHLAILATCLSLFGYLITGYYAAQDAAARKLALRNAPPETVSVVDFEPARDTGLAREVSIRAQIETSFAMRRPMMLYGQAVHALIVPLLAPDATMSAKADLIFGYTVIPLRRGESDSEALRRVLPETELEGRYGPIVSLAGQRLSHPRLATRIAKRIALWGRDAVRQGPMILPFEGPRAAALSKVPHSNFRQFFLWLTFAGITASAVLLRAQSQIARDRRLSRVDRHRAWSKDVTSAKGAHSFVPLIEQESLGRSPDKDQRSGPAAILQRIWPLRGR